MITPPSTDEPSLPVVAIVGRPNVGKSTFFNRMVGRRRALTYDRAGVTRDRNYAEVQIDNRRMIIIDTGGFEPFAASDNIYHQVRQQALLAVEEADVILMFFDGRQGTTSLDLDIVRLMQTYKKPTIYVVNKIDHSRLEPQANEFYELGVDELFLISAEHSVGLEELLDRLLELLPPAPYVVPSEDDYEAESEEPFDGEDDSSTALIRIALVGRPNVGKSSLANAILGSTRQVIHPEAGTTRDSVDLPFQVDGRQFMLVDTAGVRRKARISDKLEQFTVIKAFKAISRCDVAFLVLDSVETISAQEQRLAGIIAEKGRAVAIICNKWDQVSADRRHRQSFFSQILEALAHIRYAPIRTTSAFEGSGISGLMSLASSLYESASRRISTTELNTFLTKAVEKNSHPIVGGKVVKVYYGVQAGVRPPRFLLFANAPQLIREDYKRFLANGLRETFGFQGSPIRLTFKARRKS